MTEVVPVLAVIAALVLAYFIHRLVCRRRLRRVLQQQRPWQPDTLQRWVEHGWLEPGLAELLPGEISPAAVFYEWARVNPEASLSWRFREPVRDATPTEAFVRDAWSNLTPPQQRSSRAILTEALKEAGTWWGGAERGWNGRPLSVLESAVPRKGKPLPLAGLEDLTAAPLPGAIRTDLAAETADGPDLVLLLACARRTRPRFMHPLAPRAGGAQSLVQGLSTQVGSGMGAQIGAGLGAALGPIGSMVGRYVGEMAGRMGAKALVDQALPSHITVTLKETETALARLGELVRTDDFSRAVREPADAILEVGKQTELVRERRRRSPREWLYTTPGLAIVEEAQRVAFEEMTAYRAAADHFVNTAKKSPDAVAGGMILQNPWLARKIPGAVERLNAARTALNKAALALHKQ